MMIYADGSGNSYIIQDRPRKTLEYEPVKPEFSSSGEYDGGEPVKREITDAQFKQVQSVLKQALKKTAIHIKDRTMGSGFISIQEGDKSNSCILSPCSPEQVVIESLLKKMLKG